MACPASPPHYQRDPIATMKTAFLGATTPNFTTGRLDSCCCRRFESSGVCPRARCAVSAGVDQRGNSLPAFFATAFPFAAHILMSPLQVYGDPHVHPQPETYWGHVSCTGIRACYDEGKRVGETLCFEFNRQYGTRVRVIRIFNTYGPNMCVISP